MASYEKGIIYHAWLKQMAWGWDHVAVKSVGVVMLLEDKRLRRSGLGSKRAFNYRWRLLAAEVNLVSPLSEGIIDGCSRLIPPSNFRDFRKVPIKRLPLYVGMPFIYPMFREVLREGE